MAIARGNFDFKTTIIVTGRGTEDRQQKHATIVALWSNSNSGAV